jgi:hypothetical protein
MPLFHKHTSLEILKKIIFSAVSCSHENCPHCTGYPVRGLVFESDGPLAGLAATVGTACRLLTDANVPHNLFIVDRGSRVFLLPNAFAERKV